MKRPVSATEGRAAAGSEQCLQTADPAAQSCGPRWAARVGAGADPVAGRTQRAQPDPAGGVVAESCSDKAGEQGLRYPPPFHGALRESEDFQPLLTSRACRQSELW